MTDPAAYIHGSTDAREIARLEKQAAFVAPWSLARFDVSPGMKVLDLGTGIGAMAAQIFKRFPGVQLFGLDRDPAQLAVARERHPIATYVEGDATEMPFETASFDRVHATWLLEHVPDPLAVLREVARVLKPGGIAMFVEVDNETLRTDPPFAAVRDVMHALDRAQIAAGGDPYIGRRCSSSSNGPVFSSRKRSRCRSSATTATRPSSAPSSRSSRNFREPRRDPRRRHAPHDHRRRCAPALARSDPERRHPLRARDRQGRPLIRSLREHRHRRGGDRGRGLGAVPRAQGTTSPSTNACPIRARSARASCSNRRDKRSSRA